MTCYHLSLIMWKMNTSQLLSQQYRFFLFGPSHLLFYGGNRSLYHGNYVTSLFSLRNYSERDIDIVQRTSHSMLFLFRKSNFWPNQVEFSASVKCTGIVSHLQCN